MNTVSLTAMFFFSVFNQKYPLLTNLVQKQNSLMKMELCTQINMLNSLLIFTLFVVSFLDQLCQTLKDKVWYIDYFECIEFSGEFHSFRFRKKVSVLGNFFSRNAKSSGNLVLKLCKIGWFLCEVTF